MGGDNREPAPPSVLSFESWVLRFEEISIADLHTLSPSLWNEGIAASGSSADARESLLDALAPAFLFKGPPEPVENPAVPAYVAEVAAELEAATMLLREIFLSLFDAEVEAVAYTAATRYDGDGFPDLLGPLSVIVLSGEPSYRGRRVIYEGEWLLENLTACDTDQLLGLHERLSNAVEDEWILQSP